MAPSDPRNGRNDLQGNLLSRAAAADFVLDAPSRSVVALSGIDGGSLRGLIDEVEPSRHDRIALSAMIEPEPTTEVIVERLVNFLAETTRRLWPVWFTNVSFGGCRSDTLGRLAVGAIARSAARQIAGLSPSWTEAAARLVLDNRLPRVSGTAPATELGQLTLAISRHGLVLVAEVRSALETWPDPAALVSALEWIAQHIQGSVVVLFADLPPVEPPFDRILYNARQVISGTALIKLGASGSADPEPWIAPWRGLPHPLSDIEKRLAQSIGMDAELGPLFAFNQIVDTVRGSRPKVDLVWTAGRLVVELDGYGSHGNRTAFIYDRQRDYELTLSGYTVLRLANDEVAQDYGRAIEKIRDLVRLRRAQIIREG